MMGHRFALAAAMALLATPSRTMSVRSDDFFSPILPLSSAGGLRRRDHADPSNRYTPHQGSREIARRRRQMAAGQIHFIKHGPKV